MAHTDSRHLQVSSGNSRSMERFESALELLQGYYGDPLTMIDETLAEDPEFVMGHALRAGMLITAGDGAVGPLLRQTVETAEVQLGSATSVPLVAPQNLAVTLPRTASADVQLPCRIAYM